MGQIKMLRLMMRMKTMQLCPLTKAMQIGNPQLIIKLNENWNGKMLAKII
jgi:hypothetical protein